MTRTFALLVASALAALTGSAGRADEPAAATASLTFKAKGAVLVGTAYGLDAIDDEPRIYGQRTSAEFLAGRRTVAYTCPDTPIGIDGSRLTFDFQAGSHYELVCRNGQEAEIRVTDGC
jgi:hypothetical protein